jgi:DNA-binding MarR family transcriptional regulator
MKKDISLMPILFAAMRKKMMEQHQAILKSHHLSKTHLPYLLILNDKSEGLMQNEMSEMLDLDKALTSRSLKELQINGYVIKEDVSTYKNKFRLTEKGHDVVREFKKQNALMREKVFEALTSEEIDQLSNIISKLYQALE